MYFVRGVKKTYFMQEEHTIMKLVQAFDPSYMDEHDLTEDFVNELDTIRPIKVHKLLPEMINELGAYKQAAKNFHCDHETTETFCVRRTHRKASTPRSERGSSGWARQKRGSCFV